MIKGRYEVFWKINHKWEKILEKTIDANGSGYNHMPLFLFRRVNLPFGDFIVSVENDNIIFTYQDLPIVDKLTQMSDKSWIGELFYNGKFVDYFMFRKK